MINGFGRILLYGIQGFRRNIWLSAIAIITMVLTILTITTFTLGDVAATQTYKSYNNKLDYIIFIQDTAPDADVQLLRQQIAARPEVVETQYISKEQALVQYQKFFSDDPDLRDAFTAKDNELPREITAKFSDPSQIDVFNQFVTQDRFKQIILKTSYTKNRGIINNYIHFTTFLRIFGITFTVFFLLIAIVIILNTIRLTIFSRREEIEVMRLVGATRGFIRGPFLVEGILFGVLGALLATLLTWFFLFQVQGLLTAGLGADSVVAAYFRSSLGQLTNQADFNHLFTQLTLLQLLVGVGLGASCSFMAIRRYLKEV